jgi:hypothetical protein
MFHFKRHFILDQTAWIYIPVLLALFHSPLCAQSKEDGLNSLLGFNLWIDSTLWDDKADFTARRLHLTGSVNGATSFYRGLPPGSSSCLGAKLYALDLYAENGYVQRVVLGFLNRADTSTSSADARSRLYDEKAERDMLLIRTSLTQRLGQPNQRGASEIWPWVGLELVLNKGPEALTLSIQKGTTAPNQSPDQLPQELSLSRNPPSYFVKHNGTGDTYIQGLPPISQGDRNYCVPASWEKSLRHLGLGLNVYDLAQKGGTRVDGTLFMPFAKQMENLLTPSNYQVKYLQRSENDPASIKSYIDQGLPLIWGMNANCLPLWVLRNKERKEQLPPMRFSTKSAPPALHALLIVGYNTNYKEVAISDSTELGSAIPLIWISESEMVDAEFGTIPKIVVVPPATNKASSGGVIRPRWY